jgi:phage shock protein A
MSENIAVRVSRLISGSVNALIDAVENVAPEMVLEQAMREIDGAIDDVRADLGRQLAAKHMAHKRLLEENRKHEDLSDKIDLAVKEGRDDLAEAAIAKQFDIEAQVPVLERTIAECVERQKELEGYVGALKARRREMEDELVAFRAVQRQARSAASGAPASGTVGAERKVAGAESTFARVLSNVGVPTKAAEVRDAAKLAELEDLARKNRIRERLESVKAKK